MEIEGAIVTWALAASTVAKTTVDLARMAHPEMPKWAPPLLALVVGIAAVMLLMVSAGEAITARLAATAALAGILAAGSAVGVTELSKRAEAGGGNA